MKLPLVLWRMCDVQRATCNVHLTTHNLRRATRDVQLATRRPPISRTRARVARLELDGNLHPSENRFVVRLEVLSRVLPRSSGSRHTVCLE